MNERLREKREERREKGMHRMESGDDILYLGGIENFQFSCRNISDGDGACLSVDPNRAGAFSAAIIKTMKNRRLAKA